MKTTQIGTSLNETYLERLEAVATEQCSSLASVLRRCVVFGLPLVEKEVLGAPSPRAGLSPLPRKRSSRAA